MKSSTSSSGDSSMSVGSGSLKLRFLTFVVNTADVINERATPTSGISHAIISPVALFTTYIFIGVLIIGAIRKEYASNFLQCYALVTCSALHAYLSIVVFRELKLRIFEEDNAALVLNGILPMLIIFVLVADLIVIVFSNRNGSLPVLPQSSPQASHLDMPTV